MEEMALRLLHWRQLCTGQRHGELRPHWQFNAHLDQHVSQVGPAQPLPHTVVVRRCTAMAAQQRLLQVPADGHACVEACCCTKDVPTNCRPTTTARSPPFHTQLAACTDSAWCGSSGSRLMRPITCCPPGCCVRLTGSHASSCL